MTTRKATLGTVEKAGRSWRARYERQGIRHTPGHTFSTAMAAWAWLRSEQTMIDRDEWIPPAHRRAATEAERIARSLTLGEYSVTWMDNRTTPRGGPLATKTRYEYERYLRGRLAALGALPLGAITRADVDKWWLENAEVPTLRHHIYAFLSSVMADATDRGLVEANPCRVQHAGRRTTKRSRHEQNELVAGLTHSEVADLADAMPERYRALVPLLAYSGLRPGEALALERIDVRTGNSPGGVPRWAVSVTKAVSRGRMGPPKTPESIRTVPLPPHVVPYLEEHMRRWANPGGHGLLFPSSHAGQEFATVGQVAGSSGKGKGGTLSGFNAARQVILRPDLRLYDFRRWARHVWRQAGISEFECERLLGHKLGAVTGAYFTLDVDALWPHMERVAEQAGWRLPKELAAPTSAVQDTSGLGSLLAALDDEALARALGTLDVMRIAEVVLQLPPERIAVIMRMMAAGSPAAK